MSRKRILIPVILLIFVSLGLTSFRLYLNTKQTNKTQQVWRARHDWLRQFSTYSTTLTYDSPAGAETNPLSLVIKNGVITDVNFELVTNSQASIRYQKQFAEELPKLIVGKKIAELRVFDKISGASLTTTAFNQALSKL